MPVGAGGMFDNPLIRALLGNRQEVEQGPSVLDKPGEGIGRQIVDLLGPESLVNPTAGMVSAFKPGQLGARQAATASLMEKLEQLLGRAAQKGHLPEDIAQTRAIATKHPRTAAHQLGLIENRLAPGVSGESRQAISNPKFSKMELDLDQIRKGELSHVFAHEFGHTPQRINRPYVDTQYELLNRKLGYNANPYEIGADNTAQRKAPLPGEEGRLAPRGFNAGRAADAVTGPAKANSSMPFGPMNALRTMFSKDKPAPTASGRFKGGAEHLDIRKKAYEDVKGIADPIKMSEEYDRRITLYEALAKIGQSGV